MKVVSLALVLCACSIADAARYITLGSQHEAAWNKPFFCHDLECPKFRNLTHEGDLFETREYAPATYYYYNQTGLTFVAAYAKADVQLLRYTAGANLKGIKIPRSTPAIVRFKPTSDEYDGAERDYIVAYYLPIAVEDDPPRPENENIKIVEAPRSVAYVASFGGFGVESNILSNAKELRAKLIAEGVSFDDSKFFFNLYDAPAKLINRYNEVAFKAT